jgi:hypothetical protein
MMRRIIIINDAQLSNSFYIVQSPYVLCRLFRKQEDKADVSKYDEVENTGSSPTATRSSPDDASSDLVQATPTSGIQVGDQSEGIKRWLTDKSDNMTPTALLPVDTSSISYNSCMASDAEEDHVPEGTGIEVREVDSINFHAEKFLFFGISC